MYSPTAPSAHAASTSYRYGEPVRSSRRRVGALPHPPHRTQSTILSVESTTFPTPELSRDVCDSPTPSTPSTALQTPNLDGPIQQFYKNEKAREQQACRPEAQVDVRTTRRVGSKYAAALGGGKRDSTALRSWVTELDQAITRVVDKQGRTDVSRRSEAQEEGLRGLGSRSPHQQVEQPGVDWIFVPGFGWREPPQPGARAGVSPPYPMPSPEPIDQYAHVRSNTAPPAPGNHCTPVQKFDIRLSASGTDVTQCSPALETTPGVHASTARTHVPRRPCETIRASPEWTGFGPSTTASPSAHALDPRNPRPAKPAGPRPMPKPTAVTPIYERYVRYANTPTAAFASNWSLHVVADGLPIDDQPPSPAEWLMRTVVKTSMATADQSCRGRDLRLSKHQFPSYSRSQVQPIARRPTLNMAKVMLPAWTSLLHPPEHTTSTVLTNGNTTRTDKEISSERKGSDAFDELDEFLFAPLSEEPRIGSHSLGRLIGKGVAGRVRLATDGGGREQVAIKLVTKPFKETALEGQCRLNVLDKSQKLLALLEREVIVSKLLRHPGLARTYKVIETPSGMCLIMEYLPGGELFDLLVSRGALSPDLAARYFYQILHAVHHMHATGLIHRDIKPENMLIDGRGGVKIVDFGMTAIQPPGRMMTKSCGSPHYACPEICRGDAYMGQKADVWSLGVVLYALLNGSLPFDSKSIKELLEGIQAGFFFVPATLPWDCRDLLWSMLVLDPLKRPSTAELLGHPFLRRVTRPPLVSEPRDVRTAAQKRACRQLQHVVLGGGDMPVQFERELCGLGSDLTVNEWEQVKLLYLYLLFATGPQQAKPDRLGQTWPTPVNMLALRGVYPPAPVATIELPLLEPRQSSHTPFPALRLLPLPPSPHVGTGSEHPRQFTYSEPGSYLNTPRLSDGSSSLSSSMPLTPEMESSPLPPIDVQCESSHSRKVKSGLDVDHLASRQARERRSSFSVAIDMPHASAQHSRSLRKPKSELTLRSMPSNHTRKRDEPKARSGSGDGAWSKLVAPLMRRMKSGKIAQSDRVTEQLWASDDIDACIIEAKRILHDMQMTVIDQDAEESQILVCYFDHLDCTQRGKPRYIRVGFKLSFTLVAHSSDTFFSSNVHPLPSGKGLMCLLCFQLRNQSRGHATVFKARVGEVRGLWQLEDYTPQVEQHARMSAAMPPPMPTGPMLAARRSMGHKTLSPDWEMVESLTDGGRRARTLTR